MERIIMSGTAIGSGIGTVVFTLLHQWIGGSFFLSMAITFGTVCYHFSMRLAVGFAVKGLIKKPLDHHAWWFTPKSFEKTLYQLLRVKKWKDFMPTYRPEDFSLKIHTLEEIIQTMCISEIVHEIIAVFSFLPLFMVIPFGEPAVFLITSVLAGGFDMTFVIIQRYNRPRLARMVERKKGVRKDSR